MRKGDMQHYMNRKRMEAKTKAWGERYPKGFDITLADVIALYSFNEEQIKRLGELSTTKRSPLARATIGHNVYYRRRQIEDMFGVKPVGAEGHAQ